ncbi:MAG TPA: gamma-glutamylcyclotransferase family protein [Candidatus Tumulicola sp.]|jgi:gamma-glutamylcyclotransferase (GGCT)/AIG2-like uncharacterized protein YtfP
MSEYLFVYGTLRDPAVQLAVLGRYVAGTPDAVKGFALSTVTICDADVIAKSRETVHRILIESADPASIVEGVVLSIDSEELRSADAYETNQYSRVQVDLVSGKRSWIYVARSAEKRSL